MQNFSQTVPTYSHVKSKSIGECDFFKLLKLEHLPEPEKQSKLGKLKRLAFLHFINLDLPQLISPPDLVTLEAMTQNIYTIDLNQVQEFLKTKIPKLEAILEEKLNHIKLEAVTHHYETELNQMKLQQKTTGADYLVHILAVERLLSAISRADWELVESTVPYTKTSL